MIKSESETRRVKMTRKLIKDSLMELLETRTLSAISVTELCARADVNRSTFYAYYDDLLSVLEEVEDEMIRMIPKGGNQTMNRDLETRIIDDLELFFGYVRSYSRLLNVLLQTGDLNFKESLMREVLRNFPISEPVTSKREYLAYVFAMNGVIGITQEWIKNGFPIDDRTLARIAVKMSLGAKENNPL